MTFRLNQMDIELLTSVADYRVLAVRHLLALHQRNPHALRRRLSCLEGEGLIRTWTRGYGEKRGRPELLISLRDAGADLLKSKGTLGPDIPAAQVTGEGIRCLDHQLLANDFRVYLVQMERTVPGLSMRFLSPASPLLHGSADHRPMVHERIEPDGRGGEPCEFTPDGVFCLGHAGLGKTLLFFLEVDMGTETLASPLRLPQDVRQKVVNYQAYFRLRRYCRYEQFWGCSLRGFRVLFLVDSATRMVGICRLVQDMPPSDFIWVTDRACLLSGGVGAPIWARGGRMASAPESILGNQMPNQLPAPVALV